MPIGKTEKFVSDMQQRLCKLADALGKSNREFSRSIGKSENYIASLNNDITVGVVNKISTIYPQVNIVWLVTGKGDILCTKPATMDLYDYILKENSQLKEENKKLAEENKKLFAEVSVLEDRILQMKKRVCPPGYRCRKCRCKTVRFGEVEYVIPKY